MKTVQVRPETKQKIKRFAIELRTTQTDIIDRALACLEKLANLENDKELDRIAWYIIKLAMSVGHFKEYPDKLNYNQLRYSAKQIQERLGVDTSKLLEKAKVFMENPSKENKIALNEELKNVVKKIILLLFK